jgi:protein tyrosine phosphatase
MLMFTSIYRLTKQYEGGLVKCGNYWDHGQYGSLKLELVSQSGGEDLKPSSHEPSGFDFGAAVSSGNTEPEVSKGGGTINIKRQFLLSRSDQSSIPPKKIIQIQCTAWPDFDVPESPEVLCTLINDVDQASKDTQDSDTRSKADVSPVLVHCTLVKLDRLTSS